MSIPSSVGRYRIDRVLGSGAFASVWLGHDDALDAPVAIKVLSGSLLDDLDVRNRFLEEARILRRADSERLVRVHDIGELPDGRPYFVMSYADRGTLGDRMRERPLAVSQAIALAEEIAYGVHVINRLGVIHRDLKPSNVLFQSTPDGGERLLIADLGLAKAIAHASGAFTLPVGTPGYMSPEQARFGGGLDVRADVYGLGALTFHMITGRPPGPAPIKLKPSDLRPDLPIEVDQVILRAMEVDREKRWPTAEAFARALTTLRPTLPPGAAGEADAARDDDAEGSENLSPEQGTSGSPEPSSSVVTDDDQAEPVPAYGAGAPGQGEQGAGPQGQAAQWYGPQAPGAQWPGVPSPAAGAYGAAQPNQAPPYQGTPQEAGQPYQGAPPPEAGQYYQDAGQGYQGAPPQEAGQGYQGPPPQDAGQGYYGTPPQEAGRPREAATAPDTQPADVRPLQQGPPPPAVDDDRTSAVPLPPEARYGQPADTPQGAGGPTVVDRPGGPAPPQQPPASADDDRTIAISRDQFAPGQSASPGGPPPASPGGAPPAGIYTPQGQSQGQQPGGPLQQGPPGQSGRPYDRNARAKGRKRLIAIAIGAAIVVFALVGGLLLGQIGSDDKPKPPPKPQVPQDFAMVADASGKIRAAVPKAWPKLAAPATWQPSGVQLADNQSRPVLRATPGTIDQFRNAAAKTPGVFIGLTTDVAKGKLPPASASAHPLCTKGKPEAYTSPDKALTGTITRYTGCKSGVPTITEVGLTDKSGKFGAWIRVKEVDARKATNDILNNLKLTAP